VTARDRLRAAVRHVRAGAPLPAATPLGAAARELRAALEALPLPCPPVWPWGAAAPRTGDELVALALRALRWLSPDGHPAPLPGFRPPHGHELWVPLGQILGPRGMTALRAFRRASSTVVVLEAPDLLATLIPSRGTIDLSHPGTDAPGLTRAERALARRLPARRELRPAGGRFLARWRVDPAGYAAWAAGEVSRDRW
jgi:hypothetical protein